MNAKKALTYLAFFGIGIGLFWLAMQGVEDPEALKRDMSSASWWGIAASFVMGYLAIVSRGLRWNLLLAPNGHKASPTRGACTRWPSLISPTPSSRGRVNWRAVRP